MTIAAQAKKTNLTKPAYFVFTWGEEIGCLGVASAVKLLHSINAEPEVILINEPTLEELVIGHKGASTTKITFNTQGGHSATPELWVDVSDHMLRLHNFLHNKKLEYRQPQYHSPNFAVPYPVLNVPQFRFGEAPNKTPGTGEIVIHIRATPEITTEMILSPIKKEVEEINLAILAEHTKKNLDTTGKGVTSNKVSGSPALPVRLGHEMSGAVENIYQKLYGTKPGLKTESYCTDGGSIAIAFPEAFTFVFGAGSTKQGAHEKDEYITVEQLRNGPKLLLGLMHEICKDKTQDKGRGDCCIRYPF